MDGEEDGFSPIGGASNSKGKGKAVDDASGARRANHGVEYSVLSSDDLQNEQRQAVDYVKDMLTLNVRLLTRTRLIQRLTVVCSRQRTRQSCSGTLPGRRTSS